MKTIRYILSIFSFMLVLVGCSDDDGKVVSNDELTMASGIYNLVELNINPAQDINNDGNTTSNVLTELPCATGTFHLSCTPDTTTKSGSWNISNNQITLFDGATNFNFTKDVDRLTIIVGDDLPGFASMVFER